ncbi:MAG: flagellin FliC [Bdellovibrionales bacterium]|jgi:flagellin|nr:flagellin FliC [Bdellovibrionales bacterium]
MGMRIATNVSSISAQRSLATSAREMSKSFAQLSSGSRITKAADDAAGLSISEGLKGQIRGYAQAGRNAMDGISLVQTAEGGLSEISNIMTRLRELGVQASSDTVSDVERGFINKEVEQLKNESERIAQSTRFGKVNLLDGSGGKFDFQVDINNDDFKDRISFDASENNATTAAIGVDGVDFSTKEGAQSALMTLDDAQVQINGFRASLGAIQNRLISTQDNIAVAHENLSAANSRIRDTDVAQASAEVTRNQILQAASVSVLASANQAPQAAMKLIG